MIRPSPHSLALCVLLKHYTNSSRDTDLSEAPLARFVSFLLQETQAVARERSFHELQARLEDAVGGREGSALVQGLVSELEGACDSPDGLADTCSSLEEVLGPRRNSDGAGRRPEAIGPASPFGLYLRQFVLAVNMGQFTALSRLYDQLLKYVDSDAVSEPLAVPSIAKLDFAKL